jgi:ketosteroid isomerase-like protein
MSITERAVVEWLARYVDVWRSGDDSRVAELFTEDASYSADPFATALRGIAEIAEFWGISGDAPDAFEAEYEPLTINGDLVIAIGFSRYFDESRSHIEREYGNIFVLRFAPDGRCCEYREWYMLHDGETTTI